MLEYLQELLKELKKLDENDIPLIYIKHTKQKVIALETAIEILEKIKNNERNVVNGKIK